MMKVFLMIIFVFSIFSCDQSDSSDQSDESDQILKIIGKYSDSWGGAHIISNTVWDQGGMMGRFNIIHFDNESEFIIAQNDSNNEFSADLWSRMDWTYSASELYFCQIVFDAETEQAALEADSADREDMDGGCNGFGWTKLDEVVEEGIDKDDERIVAWASGYVDYMPGEALDEEWKTPENAIGKASGTSTDVVSLGRGGSITMTFDAPVKNGEGADFAVFENALDETFLELGYVEVSSNGTDFARFDNYYLGVEPLGPFDGHDASLIWGFAGKFKQGIGTQFDLSDLLEHPLVVDGTVDVDEITHIRIVDVVGDGSELDTLGNPIYDPYPTTGSAGFDLDGIGVINQK